MATASDLTVVAVFDDAAQASSAANDLKAAGFTDNIFVSSESGDAATYPAGGKPAAAHHEGGISGWFKNLFGAHEEDNDYRQGYESAHASGKTIVGVDTTESNVDRVSDILNRYSPVDVHQQTLGTARGVATTVATDSGFAGSRSEGSRSDALNARQALREGSPAVGSAERGQEIPVVEEELQVGKRAVQRGGVRVYSRVTERPVEESVNLREEHVRVDRQPVNRAANEDDFRAGREQVIEVDEFAEEPVVAKQARVVEEVRVGKEASERTETVRDKVRQTEVKVENLARDAGAALTGTAAGMGAAAKSARTGATGSAPVTGVANDYDDDFRQNFSSVYPAGSANYDDYAPAYRFGSDLANDQRFQGRSYSDVEPQLRDEYSRRYPNSTWDKMKDSVRYGWDRVTNKTRSASASSTNR